MNENIKKNLVKRRRIWFIISLVMITAGTFLLRPFTIKGVGQVGGTLAALFFSIVGFFSLRFIVREVIPGVTELFMDFWNGEDIGKKD